MKSPYSASSLRSWETPGSREYQREYKFESVLAIDFKSGARVRAVNLIFLGGVGGGLSVFGWNLLTLTGDWAGFIFESFGGRR